MLLGKYFRHFSRLASSRCEKPTISIEGVDEVLPHQWIPAHIVRPGRKVCDTLVGESFVEAMKKAGSIAAKSRELAMKNVSVGMTGEDIDKMVHSYIIESNGYPAAVGFQGFPKSLCISPNEVACHGIPSTRKFQLGDLVSFDCTCFIDGVYGDCCGSIIVKKKKKKIDNDNNLLTSEEPIIGSSSISLKPEKPEKPEKRIKEDVFLSSSSCELYHRNIPELLNYACYECLLAGISVLQAGCSLVDIAKAIEKRKREICFEYNIEPEFTIIDDFCGHFIGKEMHIKPFIRHSTNRPIPNYTFKVGDIFTIEPILAHKKNKLIYSEDGWTVKTADRGWTAQWEHTIHLTHQGPQIITPLES